MRKDRINIYLEYKGENMIAFISAGGNKKKNRNFFYNTNNKMQKEFLPFQK
jgi:hypothetical protein